VFIVAPDRHMTALRVSDGSQVWRSGAVEVRESIGLSDDGDRVYVRAMRDLLCALASAAEVPQKVWETNAGFGYDINSAMPVEKDGVLFYGTKNGMIIALDGNTGEMLWQHKLGPGLVNTLVPLSARAVLATDFDGVVALVEGSN
jgi:outer membrane protein assembly factor BamB